MVCAVHRQIIESRIRGAENTYSYFFQMRSKGYGAFLQQSLVRLITLTALFIEFRFGDRYQPDFIATHEGSWSDMAYKKEYRQAGKHPYSAHADAIQNDLRNLHLFKFYDEPYCFRMQVGGMMTFQQGSYITGRPTPTFFYRRTYKTSYGRIYN